MKPISVAVAAAAGLLTTGCGGATRTVTDTVAGATPAKPPAPAVVLGSKNFMPGGEGWGTAQPARIFNGGDPIGLVTHIRWSNWGQSAAFGTGLNAIFKPGGGYYSQLVTIRLRAYDIGACTPGGPRAYLKLSIQAPEGPGGPLRPPAAWAEAPSLCSSESGTPAPARSPTTTSAQPASTPVPAPQTFTGNGVQNLGTINVSAPSALEWSCPSCTIFSVTGSSSAGPVIALDSQKHTSGVTAVEPGSYHSVDVQAYGETGVAGEWVVRDHPAVATCARPGG
jgi:hypothetical protein